MSVITVAKMTMTCGVDESIAGGVQGVEVGGEGEGEGQLWGGNL